MKEECSEIVLFKIDPARNMQRFYALDIQPNLFGGYSVIRRWGRIGAAGQAKIMLFDDGKAASVAFERMFRLRQNRGYSC